MVTFDGASLVNLVAELQDRKQYQELNWYGNFGDYLELVARNPKVTRTAFQRVYDMVMSYGAEEFVDAKKRLIRYKFFSDPSIDTSDAIFGLEVPLMRLVSFLRSASEGYGTERRVLLLHGPVGSSKSTIVRRMKKGLE
ncbi:MAG: Serine protein kinase (prkA protein), P-loop containing, partial [uncultured Chloroflexia bacterium]